MKVTAFGPRYYPNELAPGDFNRIKTAIEQLNRIKFKLYDALYFQAYPDGKHTNILNARNISIHDYARSLGLDSLYANAMVPFASGILKSQETNRKDYIKEAEADLEARDAKINQTKASLAQKKAVKASIVSYAKTKSFPKPYSGCTLKIDKKGILTGWNIKPVPYQEYEYKLDADIRKLKNRISMLEEGKRRAERHLGNMKNLPPKRAIFGGRKLYKTKDTVHPDKWKESFHDARFHSVTISGRADSNNGNYIVKWNEFTHALAWTLPDGHTVNLPGFLPARYTDDFTDALKNKNQARTSVGYTIELRRDGSRKEYLIVKAAFSLPDKQYMNESLFDGCVAIDTNADRFAWAELDGNGNVLRHGSVLYDFTGMSAGQVADAVGRACRKMTDIIRKAKKPAVCEDLDPAAMKLQMRYKNKKRNRIISQFACEKLLSVLESQLYRESIVLYRVNPAYTSFQAKVLLLRSAGISVHEGAAVMIGRRALDILPYVPAWANPVCGKARPLKRNTIFAEWKKLYKAMVSIRTHAYYLKIPECKTKAKLLAWIKENDHIHTARAGAP